MISSLILLSLTLTQKNPVLNPKPLALPKAEQAVVQIIEPPKPVETPAPPPPSPPPAPEPVYASVQGGGNYNNTYAWGNCTWYVASLKAVPETWGNAYSWIYAARAQGYLTGTAPRVGAIAWFKYYGHVAIVTGVLGNGKVRISEMNYVGLNKVSVRVIDAEEAEYIY